MAEYGTRPLIRKFTAHPLNVIFNVREANLTKSKRIELHGFYAFAGVEPAMTRNTKEGTRLQHTRAASGLSSHSFFFPAVLIGNQLVPFFFKSLISVGWRKDWQPTAR